VTTHPQQIGRYQIIGQLGKGGMGAVYRGKDPVAERDVAIKVLPAEFQHNDEFKRRFQQEARIIARLEHYAIVPLYDFGTYEGQPYMVMRLLPGGSLEARLKDGPLSLPAVNGITQRICAALETEQYPLR
jgi:serine/threonine protein kinase